MTQLEPVAFGVEYRSEPVAALLQRRGALAVISFGGAPGSPADDPRQFNVLQTALASPPPHERWMVDGEVSHGRDGELRFAHGGGWRFVAIEVDETATRDIDGASQHAYDRLLEHVAASAEPRLLRVWNYLGAINAGDGDAERYRLFCNGRARSMAAHGLTRYPAATAIGHHGPQGHLQVYALCSTRDGVALENPRQVSAWQYPRQYGPTSPSFARAMQLPGGGLAISGTAAVIGHASHHVDDVSAQADEAVANLHALLQRAALTAFNGVSPLKVYVRHPEHAVAVATTIARQLDPAVPRILLQGDICRRELLVEIDGWRFAQASH